MNLDNDAQRFWEEARQLLPWPFHVLGVEAGRAFGMPSNYQGSELASITDVLASAPLAGSDVPVRVYRPVSANTVLPALLYVHGGGWSIGSVDGVDALCRELAARADCVVVSVDYRQAPEHPFPAPLDDCWTALQWLVDNADQLNVDPSRIAVAGDSAGGNLAAALTLRAREVGGPALVFQLLIYPATESEPVARSRIDYADAPILTAADVDWFWNLYLPDREQRGNPLAVPARAETLESLPAAAVLVAEFDPIRGDGVEYAALLADAGVEVTVRTYTGVYHGFIQLLGALAKTEVAIDDAASMLRTAFDETDRS